jgi:hypothetical protein
VLWLQIRLSGDKVLWLQNPWLQNPKISVWRGPSWFVVGVGEGNIEQIERRHKAPGKIDHPPKPSAQDPWMMVGRPGICVASAHAAHKPRWAAPHGSMPRSDHNDSKFEKKRLNSDSAQAAQLDLLL